MLAQRKEKMRVWIYNEGTSTDPRDPHMGDSLPLQVLDTLGVRYKTACTPDRDADLNKFCEQCGYKNWDVICVSPDVLANYEERIQSFFEEHLHEDEEVRFVLHGGGYFDVRDETVEKNSRWIRIEVRVGDFLVLPAGIYHRFTVDRTDYIKAMRLFQEEPHWVPHGKPQADGLACRATYRSAILANTEK